MVKFIMFIIFHNVAHHNFFLLKILNKVTSHCEPLGRLIQFKILGTYSYCVTEN